MSRLIYISLLLVFVLLYKTQADAQQAVFHNSGAQIVITKGADVNIQGSMLSDPSNNIAPKIQLNGNLSISGDIINHSDNLFREPRLSAVIPPPLFWYTTWNLTVLEQPFCKPMFVLSTT